MQGNYGKIKNFQINSANYGFTANVRWTFKCLIIKRPVTTVIFTLMTSILVLSYVMRIFELPFFIVIGKNDMNNYFNSIWCVVITMTTVGFGDISPYSYFGKTVIMIAAFGEDSL